MITPPRVALAAVTAVVALSLAGAAPSVAAPAKQNVWRQATPWNIAHQGGEDEFPSNTLYAFKRAAKSGVDMLELDVGVTRDGVVVVRHNTTVDSTTNGKGEVASFTLKQIRKLDAAYWYSPRSPHYEQGRPASAYPFRGIATGRRTPPKGYTRKDFRVATLAEVMAAFPRTPINVEIKGRTKTEAISEYTTNARFLAKLLKPTKRRDIIVVSFKQEATDLFHRLVPKLPVAPGLGPSQDFLLLGKRPGPGVVGFQLPVTYVLNGIRILVSSKDFIAKVHTAGYAWHTWFNDGDVDGPVVWRSLIDNCVDGVMTARPVAFGRYLKTHRSPAACRL